jgi:hypothetical protein
MKVYECKNRACDLGTDGKPGNFTNNKGVCPNCGKAAK